MYSGTGKTVLINAIDILKQLLMGPRVLKYLVIILISIAS